MPFLALMLQSKLPILYMALVAVGIGLVKFPGCMPFNHLYTIQCIPWISQIDGFFHILGHILLFGPISHLFMIQAMSKCVVPPDNVGETACPMTKRSFSECFSAGVGWHFKIHMKKDFPLSLN